MKTLILYATKHGAAREAAQRIANKMDGAVIHDIKQGDTPSLAEFDSVIIGSALYVGMIRKEAKAFLAQNADVLRSKRLGLFLCGMDGSQEQESFKTNFSPDILQASRASSFLGGIFDPQKAGVMGRLVMKAVAKTSEYTDTISNVKVDQFVEAMRA